MNPPAGSKASELERHCVALIALYLLFPPPSLLSLEES